MPSSHTRRLAAGNFFGGGAGSASSSHTRRLATGGFFFGEGGKGSNLSSPSLCQGSLALFACQLPIPVPIHKLIPASVQKASRQSHCQPA